MTIHMGPTPMDDSGEWGGEEVYVVRAGSAAPTSGQWAGQVSSDWELAGGVVTGTWTEEGGGQGGFYGAFMGGHQEEK